MGKLGRAWVVHGMVHGGGDVVGGLYDVLYIIMIIMLYFCHENLKQVFMPEVPEKL